MLVSTHFARFTSANWEKEVLMNRSRESMRLTSSYDFIVVTIAFPSPLLTVNRSSNPVHTVPFFPFFLFFFPALSCCGFEHCIATDEYKFFPAVLLSLNLLAALSEARRLRNLL